MFQQVTILGYLGRDPETRYMPDGGAVTTISVATTETWKDKQGERQEHTEWHRVAFFGRLAEIAGEYLKKGAPVLVSGRLRTRSYEQDGVKKYSTEIIGDTMRMVGGRGNGGERTEREERPQGSRPAPAKGAGGGKFDDFEDDIPF
jgi:single-strand DNA-binding protein